MIVVDANVMIAHLDAGDAHHDRAEGLLLATRGDRLGASPVTLAEVLVGPARAERLDRALAALSQLEIATVSLDEHAPVRLAVLRSATGLKLPDCCVLLAAEHSRGEVATFDDGLAGAAHDHGLTVRRQ